MPDCFMKERLRCGYVACPAEPEVDRLSTLVYRSIEIGPLAAYLVIYVSSTRQERPADRPKRFHRFNKLWRIPLYPTQDRGMSKMQSALRHHLDQIAEAELVTQIPPHAKDNHLAIEVPPSKQLLNAVQFAHRRPSTIQDHCTRRAGAVCTRALFAQVNPGTYRIEVLAEGFGPARSQPTAVAVGQTTTLNFTLSPMTASQSVEVTAQAGLLSLENPNTSTAYYWTKPSCVLTAWTEKKKIFHIRHFGASPKCRAWLVPPKIEGAANGSCSAHWEHPGLLGSGNRFAMAITGTGTRT